MATDPAQDENLLQLAVVTPNLERRWVLVYDVVPLQSYDPTLEEEKEKVEAEVREAAVEEVEVVDQPTPVAADPEPASESKQGVAATEK